jgi:hypothetical protein
MQLFQTIESKLVVITKSDNHSGFKSNQELQNVSIFLFGLEHCNMTCTIPYKTMQCKKIKWQVPWNSMGEYNYKTMQDTKKDKFHEIEYNILPCCTFW